ncbi:hypothetical protein BDK51DRAFT_45438 [Blyttiomyces helicus]|uniref:Uncharacterized protein n=1 Tax=Blyttiomyces helicus TaxID=388810 RepID=A0A4P9WH41_9FUNG|nr:hypothetical protein BDK51DRAFT_45438 [Blyttiomyces helicus]|eukprot:RKO91682.1 hypothetical protein BDK51DRAFT_45438 [Blyttiomyces helicus]
MRLTARTLADPSNKQVYAQVGCHQVFITDHKAKNNVALARLQQTDCKCQRMIQTTPTVPRIPENDYAYQRPQPTSSFTKQGYIPNSLKFGQPDKGIPAMGKLTTRKQMLKSAQEQKDRCFEALAGSRWSVNQAKGQIPHTKIRVEHLAVQGGALKVNVRLGVQIFDLHLMKPAPMIHPLTVTRRLAGGGAPLGDAVVLGVVGNRSALRNGDDLSAIANRFPGQVSESQRVSASVVAWLVEGTGAGVQQSVVQAVFTAASASTAISALTACSIFFVLLNSWVSLSAICPPSVQSVNLQPVLLACVLILYHQLVELDAHGDLHFVVMFVGLVPGALQFAEPDVDLVQAPVEANLHVLAAGRVYNVLCIELLHEQLGEVVDRQEAAVDLVFPLACTEGLDEPALILVRVVSVLFKGRDGGPDHIEEEGGLLNALLVTGEFGNLLLAYGSGAPGDGWPPAAGRTKPVLG